MYSTEHIGNVLIAIMLTVVIGLLTTTVAWVCFRFMLTLSASGVE